jgi:hypothetical protein
MEDFIYVIALIAWVAFAFYRKQQKKAEADRKMQGRPARQTEPGPGQTWQEILLGEVPAVEPEPATTTVITDGMSPVLQETSFEKEYNLRGIHSIEEMDKNFRMADFKPGEFEKKIESEVYPERQEWIEKVDLRRAVIYAEILNRPYV